jgi:hypothetical protein
MTGSDYLYDSSRRLGACSGDIAQATHGQFRLTSWIRWKYHEKTNRFEPPRFAKELHRPWVCKGRTELCSSIICQGDSGTLGAVILPLGAYGKLQLKQRHLSG